MYSNDNKSENIGFETSPLLFRCVSVLLLITEMSAKDLAAAAVEKGMSIRGAGTSIWNKLFHAAESYCYAKSAFFH